MWSFLLLCALFTVSLADPTLRGATLEKEGSDDYEKATWHSLKSHPGREHAGMFAGFDNLEGEKDDIDAEDVAAFLNEEVTQLLQQPSSREDTTNQEDDKNGVRENLHLKSINAEGQSPPSSEAHVLEDNTDPADDPTDSGRTPLIYAESNRNRVGWLMPDESIPE